MLEIGIITVSFILYITIVLWIAHVLTMRDVNKQYGYGRFTDFKKYINEYKDKIKVINGILQSEDHSIIITSPWYQFDNKIMIINNPISYLITIIYTRYLLFKMGTRATVNWKN